MIWGMLMRLDAGEAAWRLGVYLAVAWQCDTTSSSHFRSCKAFLGRWELFSFFAFQFLLGLEAVVVDLGGYFDRNL